MMPRERGPDNPRRWAVGVSADPDSIEFADVVRSAGRDWRALTVAPERLFQTVDAIRPRVIFVDRNVPHHDVLLAEMRTHCPPDTLVVNSHDLPNLRFLLRAGHA
jgi:hypothetical protein